MKKFLYPLFILFILASCAGSYKSINPTAIQYYIDSENSDTEMAYKYDVLREKGNKKYSRKELKAGVRIVALRITNTTGKAIKIGDNARIYTGPSEIRMWPSDLAYKKIKQTVPLYLLYLLLTPMEATTGDPYSSSSETFPIGLIIGPGLAGGNVAVAATANARLKEDLLQFELFDKIIKPGETVYGLVAIPEMGFVPLRVSVKP